MKIIKNVNSAIKETEISICANTIDEIERIALTIDGLDKSIMCRDVDNVIKVKWCDILYFESVDKKTFTYTKNKVLNINKRLYEIEKEMPNEFVRCSKSTIINLSRVKYFTISFESRLKVIMTNDEVVMVNRQYVKNIKAKITGGGK